MKKIKFNSKKVLTNLSQVAAVVGQKNTMPILSNVKLETIDNPFAGILMMITASDSETWISEMVDIDGDTGVNVCVDASDLLKGLRNLDDVQVEMEIDEDTKNVTCRYENGYFSLSYCDSNEFPKNAFSYANATSYTIDSKKLLSFISSVGFAVNDDELRPVFNSIHFDFFANKLVVVATDGQRLAKITDDTFSSENELKSFNLPTRPANLLLPILATLPDGDKDITCEFNENAITFQGNGFNLTTRLIEGRYPNYDSVIPTSFNNTAIVNKKSIISSIKRVSPMGDMQSELIKLNFGFGEIIISAENVDFCKKAKETLECNYDGLQELEIGFKSSHLLQSLQNIDSDEIEIKLIAHDRACVLEPHTKIEHIEYKYLLMPLLIV